MLRARSSMSAVAKAGRTTTKLVVIAGPTIAAGSLAYCPRSQMPSASTHGRLRSWRTVRRSSGESPMMSRSTATGALVSRAGLKNLHCAWAQCAASTSGVKMSAEAPIPSPSSFDDGLDTGLAKVRGALAAAEELVLFYKKNRSLVDLAAAKCSMPNVQAAPNDRMSVING